MSSNRKILFLDQYAQLGGGQKVLLTIITHLKNTYSCSAVLPGKGPLMDELDRLNIPCTILPVGYYGLGRKSVFDIMSYLIRLPYLTWRLKRIIHRQNIDIAYANGARAFPWGTLACAMTRTPLIWHVHSIFSRGVIRRLCVIFGRHAAVKKIIAVSQAALTPLSGFSGKAVVLRNAVDTSIYFPARTKSGPFRDGLALRQKYLITMAGLIMRWKGIDDFIRAAHIVVRRHPHAAFAVVGDILDTRSGSRYKRHLLKLVGDLDLGRNVVFTGFRNDIPQVLRESDIFILASRQPDPCPTALLQAMACGAAVVATNFGGPAEIISDGNDGLLYEPGNYTELADKIIFLLDNPDKRNAVAGAAVRTIGEHYREDAYLDRIKTIIDTVS